MRVNRKQKKCAGCGVKLFYPGDYVYAYDKEHMNGYAWTGKKWVKVSDMMPSNVQYTP